MITTTKKKTSEQTIPETVYKRSVTALPQIATERLPLATYSFFYISDSQIIEDRSFGITNGFVITISGHMIEKAYKK
uniref:Uncharacterized protein n=1 Tax=Onchocerca volvulus TaxID=6282 RepID=A0A8R1XXV7_ONCVO